MGNCAKRGMGHSNARWVGHCKKRIGTPKKGEMMGHCREERLDNAERGGTACRERPVGQAAEEGTWDTADRGVGQCTLREG